MIIIIIIRHLFFNFSVVCMKKDGMRIYIYIYIYIMTAYQGTPTYGQAKAGRPARTYISQLCEDTGCSRDDQPEAMNEREKWRERVRDIRVSGTTWWWWWLRVNKLITQHGDMSAIQMYPKVSEEGFLGPAVHKDKLTTAALPALALYSLGISPFFWS